MSKEYMADIAIAEIDEPVNAMRSEMDVEKIEELARSIEEQGLIQPITLRVVGKRYEIIAGHRRFTAVKMLGKKTIGAIVRVVGEADADAQRMHENLYRDDVNPVDEAAYIRLMIDKHSMTPETLAKATSKSEAYLMARYNIFDMPQYLIDALRKEEIKLTAAQYIAKIKDENIRAEYTRFAIRGGITANTARAWYESWQLGNLPREAAQYIAPEVDRSGVSNVITMKCTLCAHADDINRMTMVYAHFDCVKAAESMQNDRREPVGTGA